MYFSCEAKKRSPKVRPLKIEMRYVCVSFLGVGVNLNGGGGMGWVWMGCMDGWVWVVWVVWVVWMGSEQP